MELTCPSEQLQQQVSGQHFILVRLHSILPDHHIYILFLLFYSYTVPFPAHTILFHTHAVTYHSILYYSIPIPKLVETLPTLTTIVYTILSPFLYYSIPIPILFHSSSI